MRREQDAIDYTNRGRHISVKHYTRALQHIFKGGETGILVGETPTGTGRTLASIHWDGEIDMGPLFSEEIDILPEPPV